MTEVGGSPTRLSNRVHDQMNSKGMSQTSFALMSFSWLEENWCRQLDAL